MSENLPKRWVRSTLGEATEAGIDQSGPSGKDEFVYIDISSINNDAKRIANQKKLHISQVPSRARQRLKPRDVLVSMTRPNLNAVAVVPDEMASAVGSTGFHVLRAKGAEPDWLCYWVQTHDFIDAMCQLVQGALYPAVRPKDIRAHTILLPPLPEQRRIVEEIEKQFTRLEAGVAALKRVQAGLKRYRASVLKAACEGRLVSTEAELTRRKATADYADGKRKASAKSAPSAVSYEPASELLKRILAERRAKWTGKGKYKEPAAPDTANLPQLPEGWCWATMGQLSDIGTGATPKRSKREYYHLGNIPG